MPLTHGTWGNFILSADSFFIHCSLVHGEEGNSILVDIISSLSEILSVQISLTFALPFTLFLSLDPPTVTVGLWKESWVGG